jgi:hypothetical protein
MGVIFKFPDEPRRAFVIAHGDEAAMPQMTGIGPFNECHLANQVRFDPTALFQSLPLGRGINRGKVSFDA